MNPTIGDRFRDIRKQKNLTQRQITERTGLLEHYISRVETGNTVPTVEVLEKLARGLQVPLWHMFYNTDEPLAKAGTNIELRGSRRRKHSYWDRLRKFLGKMSEADREFTYAFAAKMVALRHTNTPKQASLPKTVNPTKDTALSGPSAKKSSDAKLGGAAHARRSSSTRWRKGRLK